MSEVMLISDAAKEVDVENHVLRYWEEELHLPIKRNDLGHRYYTREDVDRFKQIKSMKERGLQLKAIKMILKNGRLDVISEPDEKEAMKEEQFADMAINIVENREPANEVVQNNPEDKSRRLQWLLQQLLRETLQENNQVICHEIKESVIKELDYQFRIQEEREEEREQKQVQRDEAYYKKMDELLRKKSKRKQRENIQSDDAKSTKKRHSLF